MVKKRLKNKAVKMSSDSLQQYSFVVHRWAFTNYVYLRRGVGGQKNRLFVNFHTIENVKGGG